MKKPKEIPKVVQITVGLPELHVMLAALNFGAVTTSGAETIGQYILLSQSLYVAYAEIGTEEWERLVKKITLAHSAICPNAEEERISNG